MKVFITGGAGYLGSVITKRLLEDGHNVTVLDKLLFNFKAGIVGLDSFDAIYGNIYYNKQIQ